MADGTSVGKISLEVDLNGDMQKQISNMASNLSTALKSSLEKATSGMLSGVEKVIDSAMKNINDSINQGLEKMKTQMEAFITSLENMSKKIKVPNKMPVPADVVPAMNPVIPSISPRGPPMATPKVPALNSEAIQGEIDKVSQHLDLINQKIELQQAKLVGLKESYERALNPDIKNKLATQINNTELGIMKLTEASDKMGYKLNDLDSKMNETAQATDKMGAAVDVAPNKMKQSASKATQNMTPLGKASEVVGSKFNAMGRMINSALKRVLVMGVILKVIRGFVSYMGSALATNTQFANSLAIVKSNLQVAFIPIFNAILPALNALMSGIATATTYLASFFSLLGGSSYKASTASAKALNNQKAAIAGVGAASKKTAKEMQKTLAGFDEITNLSTPEAPDAGGGGGGGASAIAPIVSPGIDTSAMENSIQAFLAKLDPYLEPARQALGRLKDAFEPLKQNIFAGLKWLMDNILIPLGKWTITEVVPRFIDILAGVFKVLNAAIEALKPLFQWLWDNMLKPLAEWTGGVIVDVLDGINVALSDFANWISNNEGLVQGMAKTVGGFMLAWKATEVLGFIGESGGLIAALKKIAEVTIVASSAKLADKIETMALTAMYAKDFIVSVANSTKELVIQGAKWVWITGLKIADTIAQGAMTLATGAWNVICIVATGVTTAFGAAVAFLTSPIGIAIAAIAAIIAIGILLWKNWDQVSAWLKKTWDGIKTAAATIWGNIVNTIKGVFKGIGEWFSGVFTGAWNGIKKAFSAVGTFFDGIWTTIKNTFTTIGSVIGNGIGNAFKTVVNSIISFAEITINGFIRAINRAITLINKVPGVNINPLTPLSIPKLATGGMIEQPTLAMVGEAGKEAVLPIDKDRGAMEQIANMLLDKMGGGAGGGDYETSAEVDGDILFKIVMKRLNKRRRQKNLPIIEY